ncbi:hypothetical protein [Paenibacillus sp. YPG26]|uniref:hypothetical protein n=1 Tax=Paenibacillus sp. YPG26 TaxID=2878915 RepID=UPI00203B2BD2|nr:hypothetical protein [Paenibacillus sp. YPG26]USB33376.1 hypothetical protein LDO05_00585 [Paenibacillus sp. YPG26]
MSKLSWYQNPFLCGLFVSLVNLILFISVIGLSLLSVLLSLGFVWMLFPILGVVINIWFWIQVGMTWGDQNEGRIVTALIGGAFYWVVFLFFIYRYVTLTPQFEGDDTFMTAIGLFMGILISFIAGVLCIWAILYCSRLINKDSNYA